MIQWEYRVEALAAIQIDRQLNFMGEEGWELIVLLERPQEETLLCILKRPKDRHSR